MPVEQVPGFWDYLNQGIQRGVQYSREDAANKQAEADKHASLMTQLYQAGATDSTSLSNAVAATGEKGVNILPSKAEQRKKILATPGGVDALTDEQRTDLGFPTLAEKKVADAQGATADVQTIKAKALIKFANGEDLTDNEGDLVGLGSKQDREINKLKTLDPYLGQVGDRFVAGAMNQNGGRIPPGGAQTISDKAYADYIGNRAQSGLPPMTPEQLQYTKTFMDKSVQNALIAQTRLDNDTITAEAARTHAGAARTQANDNEGIRWFGQLNTAVESLRKAQANLMRASPALAAALADPKLAAAPMIKGAYDQYNTYESQINALRIGQAALGNNTTPSNLTDLLAAAAQITNPPGGAAGNIAATPPDPVQAAAERLVSGAATVQQLQKTMQEGRITPQMYNQILKKVQELQKKGAKAVAPGGAQP